MHPVRSPRAATVIATAVIACLLAPMPTQAQEPSGTAADSAAVGAVIDRYHAALAAGDSATALSLLAPGARILESGGIETREEYRSHHLPGDIAYARTAKTARGPRFVTVRGDVAWASSTSTTTREGRSGMVTSNGAELVVLTRAREGWLISAIHWSSRTVRPTGG